jgi:protein tyrosine phosphatase (PTP) superfamily phosphohydrolase (DUF442 family)
LLLAAIALLPLSAVPAISQPRIGVVDFSAPAASSRKAASPLVFADDAGRVTHLEALPTGGLGASGGRVYAPEEFDVLWCHQAGAAGAPIGAGQSADLLAYLQGGGAILISGAAGRLVSDLGIDSQRMTIPGPLRSAALNAVEVCVDQRSHPLFSGLDPTRLIPIGAPAAGGEPATRATVVPFSSAPTSTEESVPDPAIVEYWVGKGRLILMGWDPSALDRLPGSYRSNLKRLFTNALTYLAQSNSNRARLVVPPGGGLYLRIAGVPFLSALEPVALKDGPAGAGTVAILSTDASASATPAEGGLYVARQRCEAGSAVTRTALGMTVYQGAQPQMPAPVIQPELGVGVPPGAAAPASPVLRSELLARIVGAPGPGGVATEGPPATTDPASQALARFTREIEHALAARAGQLLPPGASSADRLVEFEEQARRIAATPSKTSEIGAREAMAEGTEGQEPPTAMVRPVARSEAETQEEARQAQRRLAGRVWALVVLLLILMALPAIRAWPAVSRMSPFWLSVQPRGRRRGTRIIVYPLTRPRDHIPGLPNFAAVSPPLCRGGQPDADGFAQLKALGIKTVVNFRESDTDREYLQGLGLQYVHIPFTHISLGDEKVADFLQVIEDPANHPVFMHCEWGSDRTGAMTAIYRAAEQGWPMEIAARELLRFGFDPDFRDLLWYLALFDAGRVRRVMASTQPPRIQAVP